MLTKILTYRIGVVIILIVAISSVYVCQVLCDLDINSMKRTCHTTLCSGANQTASDSKDSHSSSGHHHNPKVQVHHDQTSRLGEIQASHHSEQDDDCCEDMKTKVLESLLTQKINIPSFEAKLFFAFEIEVPLYNVSLNNIVTDFFKFYSDSSPPTSGRDIVVLVQSFLL